MDKPLPKLKRELLDGLLSFLWRQWTALGVPGRAGSARHVVDPEALLALTAVLGRHDPRLYDEALGWLAKYGRLVSVQRLRTIFSLNCFSPAAPAAAAGIACCLLDGTGDKRWESLCRPGRRGGDPPQPLFLDPSGAPLPVLGEPDPSFLKAGLLRDTVRPRNHAGFRPENAGALVARLRALLGNTARCEILFYLLARPHGYPSEIARKTHYSQKTVHDLLEDMVLSGAVRSVKNGRQRLCRLAPGAFPAFLLQGQPRPEYVNWPLVLGAVESAWQKLGPLSEPDLPEDLVISGCHALSEALSARLMGVSALAELPQAGTASVAAALRPLSAVMPLLAE